MKFTTKTLLLALPLGMSLLVTGQAKAAGCLSGAVVGGVVGHVAGHHAVLGAVGGCIVGHEKAKHEKEPRAHDAVVQAEGIQHKSKANVSDSDCFWAGCRPVHSLKGTVMRLSERDCILLSNAANYGITDSCGMFYRLGGGGVIPIRYSSSSLPSLERRGFLWREGSDIYRATLVGVKALKKHNPILYVDIKMPTDFTVKRMAT